MDVGEWAHTQTHTHCLRAQRKVEGEWGGQGHRFQ